MGSKSSAYAAQLAQPGIIATSGNVANNAAAASLPAVANKLNYLTGVMITGSGATAGLVVQVTVAGVATPFNLVYAAAAGVLVANTPLILRFPAPIPASAVNTAITVTCPALGAGNTNNIVTIFGFTRDSG